MPSAFARSCEIKTDALDRGQWRVAERIVGKKTKEI